jgi:choline dehydrogenase-like flavoprotein
VANVNEEMVQNYQKVPPPRKKREFDFIVIGSGPGGAVSANKLQEAGLRTCLLESGGIYKKDGISPFSYNEMLHQYKHAGITTTLGNANITYVEGATFGGGSEINSGLYHRTPKDVLSLWKTNYRLVGSEPDKMEKYFTALEKDLCISYFPAGQIPKASIVLEDGANKLDWKVQEVPRWFKYKQSQSGSGIKMTMTKTYLKNYLDNGGLVYEFSKAKTLKKYNGKWNILFDTINGESSISAKNVILSAGTIGTPQLLRRSGLSQIAGKRFQMHPTIKVVALFDKNINQKEMGVPVHQVKEFAPDYSFGCSISSKPYLRVAMLDHPNQQDIVEQKWQKMAIYYAMITPEGNGSIKNLPFFKDPLITYRLTKHDKNNLAKGLEKLSQLLISAGARSLYPSIKGGPVITNLNDISQLPPTINPANTSLMSVHLFSSCPIGERKDICVADSFGKVFGQEGLFISDGSMLPSAPGVNPQGSIMAFALRNIEKIITEV